MWSMRMPLFKISLTSTKRIWLICPKGRIGLKDCLISVIRLVRPQSRTKINVFLCDLMAIKVSWRQMIQHFDSGGLHMSISEIIALSPPISTLHDTWHSAHPASFCTRGPEVEPQIRTLFQAEIYCIMHLPCAIYFLVNVLRYHRPKIRGRVLLLLLRGGPGVAGAWIRPGSAIW